MFYWQNRSRAWWNTVSMECCHVHDMPQLHSAQQCVGTFTNAEKTFSDSFQSFLSLAELIGMLHLLRAHVHNAVRPCFLPCMWTSVSPATLVKSLTTFGCISIISGNFGYPGKVDATSRFILTASFYWELPSVTTALYRWPLSYWVEIQWLVQHHLVETCRKKVALK